MINQIEYIQSYPGLPIEENRIVYYDSEILTDEEALKLIKSGQSQFNDNVIDVSLEQRKLLKKLFEQLKEDK